MAAPPPTPISPSTSSKTKKSSLPITTAPPYSAIPFSRKATPPTSATSSAHSSRKAAIASATSPSTPPTGTSMNAGSIVSPKNPTPAAIPTAISSSPTSSTALPSTANSLSTLSAATSAIPSFSISIHSTLSSSPISSTPSNPPAGNGSMPLSLLKTPSSAASPRSSPPARASFGPLPRNPASLMPASATQAKTANTSAPKSTPLVFKPSSQVPIVFSSYSPSLSLSPHGICLLSHPPAPPISFPFNQLPSSCI